jgi:hypothetical protein
MSRLFFFCLLLASPLWAEDWTTTDGKTYKDVKVIQVDPDGVSILDADGGAKIPMTNLSVDLQKRFNYDSAKAAVAIAAKKEAEDKEAAQRNAAAASENRFSQWTTELKRKVDARTNGSVELLQNKGATSAETQQFEQQADEIINRFKLRLQALRELIAILDAQKATPEFIQQVIDETYEEKVFIGMPKAAVFISWGLPKKVNDTINDNGKSQQLIYDSGYVYLDDGKVSSIQSP